MAQKMTDGRWQSFVPYGSRTGGLRRVRADGSRGGRRSGGCRAVPTSCVTRPETV